MASKKNKNVVVSTLTEVAATAQAEVAATAQAEVAATAQAEVAATTPKVKKPRAPRTKGMWSFREAQMVLLLDGLPLVQEAYNANRVSRPTLKRALTELRNSGRSGERIDALAGWIGDITVNGDRGRKALTSGESRIYKAQQVKDSGTFLRLPLDVIGVAKGALVAIRVSADGRTILVGRPADLGVSEPVAAEAAPATETGQEAPPVADDAVAQ